MVFGRYTVCDIREMGWYFCVQSNSTRKLPFQNCLYMFSQYPAIESKSN